MPRRFRRGFYLLPTLFTVGNLFCGYSSILYAAREAFWVSSTLIIVAAFLDGLDGRIARLTNTTSDFGVQFDSLADIVSFGLAPTCLIYYWVLQPLGRAGWLVAFLYVVCAAMRLARFNLQKSSTDKKFFAGLPSPAAAGAVASVVFVFPSRPEWIWLSPFMAILHFGVALLMVSRFRYRSFKDFDLRNRRSYVQILPIAAVLVGLLALPALLLVVAAGYVLSGPLVFAWGMLRRRGRIPATPAADRLGDGR